MVRVTTEKVDKKKSLDVYPKEKIINALLESESQKEAIADGYSGILALFGPDMKAKWVNKATYVQFAEPIGKSCHEIFCAKNGTCHSCALRRSLETGAIESTTQHTGVFGDDGDEIIFDITSSPIIDKHGEVESLIGIAQNVTEQYRLEKQLRHTQKMEAIGTLAGGLAHDFNNVLTPIMGYTEIIRLKMTKDGSGDQAVFEYLEEILKAAKRAKSLVEQVLTFSRNSEEKEVLQYIHPIVKETMNFLRGSLPSTIAIKEEIDEKCGRSLVDPVQIHQVLINLCTNAAHAMEGNHGVMTIKLGRAESSADGKEWVELSVADTGCGIEKEIRERIFEPYFSTKEKTSGTGMGLAMVHGIVNRQGGRLEVESVVGEGSVFRVLLPVVKGESFLENILSVGTLQGGTGKILLVDDEEQIVRVTGKLIQNLGYTVVGKTSSLEAIEAFSDSPYEFDMVLTDLTMPGLTGLELSEKIKTVRPDLPIVLFTGHSDQLSKDAAVAAGIDEFCMKPVSMRGLSTILSKVLGSVET